MIVKALTCILLLFYSGACAAEVALQMPLDTQKQAVEEHLIAFYAQELFQAGVCPNLSSARLQAEKECFEYTPTIRLIAREEICGYLAYSIDGTEGFLDALYLYPKYRGRGLGSAALGCVEEELKRCGVCDVQLYVFAHNCAALKLYERHGYHVLQSYNTQEGCAIGYSMGKMI